MDPFAAFRVLMTIVLAGVWLYTAIDALIFLCLASRRRKAALAEIPVSSTSAARFNDRLIRLGKKYALLKALEVLSLRTIYRNRRELGMIVLLFAVDAVALYFFYTL